MTCETGSQEGAFTGRRDDHDGLCVGAACLSITSERRTEGMNHGSI